MIFYKNSICKKIRYILFIFIIILTPEYTNVWKIILRSLAMRWITVKNVNELKSLGKFKDVKREIKEDVGDNIKITGRGWNDLYKNITIFSNLIENIYKSDLKSIDIDIVKSPNIYSNYFTSKSNEYIFYLTELDGEIRMKKLGIKKSLFNNKRAAKAWRDEILKEIHPDINNHPKSTIAMAKLNEMYHSMVDKN